MSSFPNTPSWLKITSVFSDCSICTDALPPVLFKDPSLWSPSLCSCKTLCLTPLEQLSPPLTVRWWFALTSVPWLQERSFYSLVGIQSGLNNVCVHTEELYSCSWNSGYIESKNHKCLFRRICSEGFYCILNIMEGHSKTLTFVVKVWSRQGMRKVHAQDIGKIPTLVRPVGTAFGGEKSHWCSFH